MTPILKQLNLYLQVDQTSEITVAMVSTPPPDRRLRRQHVPGQRGALRPRDGLVVRGHPDDVGPQRGGRGRHHGALPEGRPAGRPAGGAGWGVAHPAHSPSSSSPLLFLLLVLVLLLLLLPETQRPPGEEHVRAEPPPRSSSLSSLSQSSSSTKNLQKLTITRCAGRPLL